MTSRSRSALAGLALLTLTGCGAGDAEPIADPALCFPLTQCDGTEPAAEVTPDPSGPGHIIDHRTESNTGDLYEGQAGTNAFTIQWPDGTASWCFSYKIPTTDSSPELVCKDVPEGWDA